MANKTRAVKRLWHSRWTGQTPPIATNSFQVEFYLHPGQPFAASRNRNPDLTTNLENVLPRSYLNLKGRNLVNVGIDTNNPEHILQVAEMQRHIHARCQKDVTVLESLEIYCFGGISDESIERPRYSSHIAWSTSGYVS